MSMNLSSNFSTVKSQPVSSTMRKSCCNYSIHHTLEVFKKLWKMPIMKTHIMPEGFWCFYTSSSLNSTAHGLLEGSPWVSSQLYWASWETSTLQQRKELIFSAGSSGEGKGVSPPPVSCQVTSFRPQESLYGARTWKEQESERKSWRSALPCTGSVRKLQLHPASVSPPAQLMAPSVVCFLGFSDRISISTLIIFFLN